jgi:CPA2 family monovalent cation:H+ antiporter-2
VVDLIRTVPHDLPVLNDLLIILIASVPIAFAFKQLRLPTIAGFMMTGIAIGPYGLGLIADVAAIEVLAEIGVVLLLFTIGLEFSLRRILHMRRLVVWGGGLQVVVTVGVTAAAAAAVGMPANQAVFAGFLVALSSTAIVLKTYMDQGETDAPHGRVAIGILLFQDLVIVPMMLLVPILSGTKGTSPLGIATTLGTAVFAVVANVFVARAVMPFLLHHVVRLRTPEVFVIFIVIVSLGTSWITAQAGLSLALGAFIAGLVLSESEYSHQIVADILPFRDVFNSVFFISIGMLLSLGALASTWPIVLGLVVALIVAKALVAAGVVRVLGYSIRVAVIAGLGLAQIGEFSFVLAKVGLAEGLLSATTYQVFLGTAILSMIVTPFLMKAAPAAGYRVQALISPDSLLEASMLPEGEGQGFSNHVVIVGYGINGRNVARVLRSINIRYKVLELNPEAVRLAREHGEVIGYGDATRAEVLRHTGVERARILVIAIADPVASRHVVHLARQMNPDLHIIVRTRYMSELEELHQLGANQVIPEEFETSLEISARVLAAYGFPRITTRRHKDRLRREGYQALRDTSYAETDLGSLSDVLESAITETLALDDASMAAGKRIGQLDLRRLTGATIIAVHRLGDTEVNPGPDFELAAGDALVLLGSPEQIDLAVAHLVGAPGTSALG